MTRHRSHAQSASTAGFPRGLLVLGLIVGLGLTFYIGMHYGNARGPHLGQNAVQEKKLSRLDRQEQELRQRRAQERARLSFHSTLAGPARVAKRLANKASIKKVIAKANSKPANTEEIKTSEKHTAATTNDSQAEQDKVLVKNSLAAEQENKTIALALTEKQKIALADDVIKATQDKQDTDAQEEDNELAQDSEASHFSLQVGAFPDAGSAQSLVERLSEKGYTVRIVSAEVEGKGTWYRVRVGNFKVREKAEQKCSQLSDHEGLFALVVPERS